MILKLVTFLTTVTINHALAGDHPAFTLLPSSLDSIPLVSYFDPRENDGEDYDPADWNFISDGETKVSLFVTDLEISRATGDSIEWDAAKQKYMLRIPLKTPQYCIASQDVDYDVLDVWSDNFTIADGLDRRCNDFKSGEPETPLFQDPLATPEVLELAWTVPNHDEDESTATGTLNVTGIAVQLDCELELRVFDQFVAVIPGTTRCSISDSSIPEEREEEEEPRIMSEGYTISHDAEDDEEVFLESWNRPLINSLTPIVKHLIRDKLVAARANIRRRYNERKMELTKEATGILVSAGKEKEDGRKRVEDDIRTANKAIYDELREKLERIDQEMERDLRSVLKDDEEREGGRDEEREGGRGEERGDEEEGEGQGGGEEGEGQGNAEGGQPRVVELTLDQLRKRQIAHIREKLSALRQKQEEWLATRRQEFQTLGQLELNKLGIGEGQRNIRLDGDDIVELVYPDLRKDLANYPVWFQEMLKLQDSLRWSDSHGTMVQQAEQSLQNRFDEMNKALVNFKAQKMIRAKAELEKRHAEIKAEFDAITNRLAKIREWNDQDPIDLPPLLRQKDELCRAIPQKLRNFMETELGEENWGEIEKEAAEDVAGEQFGETRAIPDFKELKRRLEEGNRQWILDGSPGYDKEAEKQNDPNVKVVYCVADEEVRQINKGYAIEAEIDNGTLQERLEKLKIEAVVAREEIDQVGGEEEDEPDSLIIEIFGFASKSALEEEVRLQQALSELRAELARENKEKELLQAKFDQLDTSQAEERNRKAELEENLRLVNEELGKKRDRIATLEDDIRDAHGRIEGGAETEESLNERITQLEEELEGLANTKANKTDELEQKEADILENEGNIASGTTDNETSRTRIGEVQGEIATKTVDLERITRVEREGLNDDLARMENELADTKRQEIAGKRATDEKKSELKSLKAELTTLNNELKELEAEIRTLEAEETESQAKDDEGTDGTPSGGSGSVDSAAKGAKDLGDKQAAAQQKGSTNGNNKFLGSKKIRWTVGITVGIAVPVLVIGIIVTVRRTRGKSEE